MQLDAGHPCNQEKYCLVRKEGGIFVNGTYDDGRKMTQHEHQFWALVQCHWLERQTDRQTDGRTDGKKTEGKDERI